MKPGVTVLSMVASVSDTLIPDVTSDVIHAAAVVNPHKNDKSCQC